MNSFRAKEFLDALRRKIDTALDSFFRSEVTTARHPLGSHLIRAIHAYTLRKGAKRTRGTLVVLGYLSNPRNRLSSDILKIAAAYELLHAYLLVHDDIIDQDVLRRGGPTLHKVFERLAPAGMATKERNKIGTDIAIIAGDITADLVQRCVLGTGFSLDKKVQALEIIERTLHTTYIGQVLDILAVPEKIPRMDQQILRYRQKTAIYTIESPFMLGARIGGSRVNAAAFHAFAQDTGVAFQLSDDVQNVFSKGLAGRSSDILHGKITLLTSFALQSRRVKKPLLRLLAKEKKNARDLSSIRRLMIESGGYDRAVKLISQLYRRAGALVHRLNLTPRVEACCEVVLQGLQKLASG